MNLSDHHQVHTIHLAREAHLVRVLEQRRAALERLADERAASATRRGRDVSAPAPSGATPRPGLAGTGILRTLLDRLGLGRPPTGGPRPAI